MIQTPLAGEAGLLLRDFLAHWYRLNPRNPDFSAEEQFAIRIAFEWLLAEQRRRAYALQVPP